MNPFSQTIIYEDEDYQLVALPVTDYRNRYQCMDKMTGKPVNVETLPTNVLQAISRVFQKRNLQRIK